ncbi:GGDEF domain-containing protein [Deinococcus radiomollis]|uniref:GGDEF domain-containing protein n=1 Tax=Deinococcus radiomollis TaxID=468916 RepID=UPI0038919B2C
MNGNRQGGRQGHTERLLARLRGQRLGGRQLGGAWDVRTVAQARRGTFLLASVIGVPTLLCLWLYAFLYRRDNVLLLCIPLLLAGMLAAVLIRSRGTLSFSAQWHRVAVWSALTFGLLCLLYRAAAPQQFDQGLNLVLALWVVLAAVLVCFRLAPVQSGLALGLLEFLHGLPLLDGLARRTLRGGPLLIELVSELTLITLLLLLYGSSWMRLALGNSEATSAQLEHLSRTDHLTGLYNRRSLYSSIEALMAELALAATETGETGRAARRVEGAEPGPPPTFSVVLLDIDHFKNVNDTFGHASGDTVLRAVAEVLQSFLRQRDLAGRWGGEEFVLVLAGVPLLQAARIAERLRQKIESAYVLENARVTASFGVTCWQPGDSLEAVMARADGAMYCAKHLGRNRVELAEPLLQPATLGLTQPVPN